MRVESTRGSSPGRARGNRFSRQATPLPMGSVQGAVSRGGSRGRSRIGVMGNCGNRRRRGGVFSERRGRSYLISWPGSRLSDCSRLFTR